MAQLGTNKEELNERSQLMMQRTNTLLPSRCKLEGKVSFMHKKEKKNHLRSKEKYCCTNKDLYQNFCRKICALRTTDFQSLQKIKSRSVIEARHHRMHGDGVAYLKELY